jgi:integrase
MAKVTKRLVDGLAPTERDQFVWDEELRGFGLRCRPSGAKIYLLKARIGRRQRWLTIGRHGSPWTPDLARKEARRLLCEIVQGKDPAREREADRTAGTVAELCDLYLAEGTATKKPSTVRNDESRIRNHIKPLIGAKKLREVSRGDIERFQAAVAAGKTATDRKTGYRGRRIVTGGKGAARLTMILLSRVFSFAVDRKLMAANPCAGIKRFPGGKSERFLSAAEQVRLGEALAAAELAGVNPTPIAVIHTLALTGARLGEILGLRWSEVDFERACLRLPDSKTGAKVIPLGAAALELLAGQERRAEYVFPSEHRKGPIADIANVWQRVREAAGLADVRLHDLRHSFASNIVIARGSLPVIGALLGHRSTLTTARYAHLADDPLRAVADRASGSIAAALAGKPAAEVVPLERRKA